QNPTDVTELLTTYNSTTQIIMASIGIFAISYIFSTSKRYVEEKFRIYHLNKQVDMLSIKVSSLDVADFEDPKVANAITKAQDNIYRVRGFFLTSIRILTNLIGVSIGLLVLARFNILFGLLII